MHHAAAILGDHRQAVQGAFGIQDGMEREFQMRGHAGGLAVKDIPVIVLITGVVRGIGSFLVGGGDDLALRGRGNGDFAREGPCAVVGLDVHAAGGAGMARLIVYGQDDLDGFAVRKFARVQNAELFSALSYAVLPHGNGLSGGTHGSQRPVLEGQIRRRAPDIQYTGDDRAILRRQHRRLRRGPVNEKGQRLGRPVFQRVRQIQRHGMLAVRERGNVDGLLAASGSRQRRLHTLIHRIAHGRKAAIGVGSAFPQEFHLLRIGPDGWFQRHRLHRRRAAVNEQGGSSFRAHIARDIHAPHRDGMLAVRKRGDVDFKSGEGFVRQLCIGIGAAIRGVLHAQQVVQVRDAGPGQAGGCLFGPAVRQDCDLRSRRRGAVHLELRSGRRAIVAVCVHAADIDRMRAVRKRARLEREGAVGAVAARALPVPRRGVLDGRWIDRILDLAAYPQRGGMGGQVRNARPCDRVCAGAGPVHGAYAHRDGLVGRRGIGQDGIGPAEGRAGLPIGVGGLNGKIIVQVRLVRARNIGQLLPSAVPVDGVVSGGHLRIGRPERLAPG